MTLTIHEVNTAGDGRSGKRAGMQVVFCQDLPLDPTLVAIHADEPHARIGPDDPRWPKVLTALMEMTVR